MGPPGRTVVPEREDHPAASPSPPRPDHHHHHPASPLLRQQQRKGAAARAWLVVPESGPPRTEELWKHLVMRRTGIPARDLRILDPVLSYPSAVLGRERAIVVKLEHVKAIITATEVLVPNFKDPLVETFVRELQLRVSGVRPPPMESEEWAPRLEGRNMPLQHPSRSDEGTANPCAEVSPKLGNSLPVLRARHTQPMFDRAIARVPKVLPFEFRALEVCLECACNCVESETSTLEQEAYPALDALTSKISTLNLERVRQIKSRLVLLSGRVHKVRDELEHLLDDDTDMAEMHLTEKLAQQQLEAASSSDALDDDDDDDVDFKRDISFKKRGSNENVCSTLNTVDLEMLLEAYFVRADGTLNKLSTLREYVDDTEDYINIMLDDKQNQLLQMGVVLSGATMILSAGIVAMGVLGMNIHIGVFDSPPSTKFWEAAIGCAGSCVVLFITALAWGKRSGVLS